MRSAGAGTRWRGALACLAIAIGVSALLPGSVAQANVTLGRFAAEAKADHVHLTWETASEFDTAGYFVERSLSAAEGFAKASEIILATGGGPTGADYSWDDRRVERGTTYYYRLVEIESDQTLIRHPQVVCGTPGGPPCRTGASPPTATTRPSTTSGIPTTIPQPSSTIAPASNAQPTVRPTASSPAPTQAATRRPGGGASSGSASSNDRSNPTQAPAVSSPVAANPAPPAGSRAGAGRPSASTPTVAQGVGSSPSTANTGGGDPGVPASVPAAGPGGASVAQVSGTDPGGDTAGDAAGDDGGTADESSGTPPVQQMAAMQPGAELAAGSDAGLEPAVPAGSVPGAGTEPAAPAFRWLWVALIGLAFLFVARRVLRLTRQG